MSDLTNLSDDDIARELAARGMSSPLPPAQPSNQISALVTRYKDAYLVATVTDGFGKLIKGVGIIVGGLLVLAGFMFIGNGRIGDATFALGVVAIAFGIFVGVLFYLLGVLVSAQGQILKASLDSAVNNSPFLANKDRAKIMLLPKS